MNVFLIHGDYLSKSSERLQKYLQTARDRKWLIEYIGLNANQGLSEALTVQNLFNEEKLYVVENFKNLKAGDFKWLKQNAGNLNGNLVIYADISLKEADMAKIPFLKKAEEFKTPKVIFDFLASFYPKNQANCLKYLKALKENEPPEFIFSLLARHLRDLYWVKANASNIPYPSWRVEKLERQAGRFNKEGLKKMINLFSESDIKAKTSDKAILDLLDLIIATKLK